jgi:hypothetical protein
MGNFRSLRHEPTVVDQSVGRSCASVSRGKHVSNVPIGAMGNSQVSATRTCTFPPVMLSPISCTTPNEPGSMFSTRRGLEELACASSTTKPAIAASRTTLLVMLSSALSMYVPGARRMRPTAVLASALIRPVLVLKKAVIVRSRPVLFTVVLFTVVLFTVLLLTAVCSSRRWLGTSCMENSPGMSLASVQGSTVHESGGGDNMGHDGGGWDGIRTCGGVRIGDSGMGGGGAEDQGGVGPESGGYKDSVDGSTDWGGVRRGGGRVGDGSGVDGDDGGSDHGVGDAGEGGKGDRGNGGAVAGLLPAEELSALVGLGATPAWACCA